MLQNMLELALIPILRMARNIGSNSFSFLSHTQLSCSFPPSFFLSISLLQYLNSHHYLSMNCSGVYICVCMYVCVHSHVHDILRVSTCQYLCNIIYVTVSMNVCLCRSDVPTFVFYCVCPRLNSFFMLT